jgi:hypothetical protein
MRSILQTCQPRADLHTGSFTPEIFTASLSQVTDCYRGRAMPIQTLYTDAEQFFREATYPTQGSARYWQRSSGVSLAIALCRRFIAWRPPLAVAKPTR